MRFGICGGGEWFEAIRDAGADYVEPPVTGFADPEGPESVWRERLARLRDAGLTAEAWNCFLPGDLKFIGPGGDMPRFENYAEVAIARLYEAGARTLVFGSGAARSAPSGYDPVRALMEFSDAVVFVASMARSAEITVAIESLPERETNVVNDLLTAGIVSKVVMQPNVACCADFWHIYVETDWPREVEAVGDTIGHAHVADTGRRAPGTGTLEIADFFTALASTGYEQRVSVVSVWYDFDAEVGPSLAFLREQWAAATQQGGTQ
jgi:sugar phosphate isomerase/epimerase